MAVAVSNGTGANALPIEHDGVDSKEISVNGHAQDGGSSKAQKPYELLANGLGFPSEDEQFWWNATAPSLGDLMSKANYSPYLQYQYLCFYHQYILRSLGPRPRVDTKPGWASHLNHVHCPVEPSLNVNGLQEVSSTIRFTVEPIGARAGTAEDPFNQLMGEDLIKSVQPACSSYDLEWFQHFASELYIPDSEVSALKARMPPGLQVPQSFIAFDLARSRPHITPKAYFFPILKSIQTGTPTHVLTSHAIQKLHRHDLSLNPALALFDDYLSACSSDKIPPVEMISIDCIPSSQSRIKIYPRLHTLSLNAVKDLYTLGGRLRGPVIDAGVAAFSALWPLLMPIPQDAEDADAYEVPRAPDRSAGICFCFEIKPGKAEPEPKFYIPAWHYSKTDLQVAEGLSRFFGSLGWQKLAESYTRNLKETL